MAGVEKWVEWAAEMAASAAAVAAAWGAAGGMTNVLATNMTIGAAIRHVLLGALIAAGAGGLIGQVLAHYILPDAPEFRTGMTVGVSGFLSGAFGASVFERIRATIRADDDSERNEEDPHRKP